MIFAFVRKSLEFYPLFDANFLLFLCGKLKVSVILNKIKVDPDVI